MPKIDKTLEAWRRFLLGECRDPGSKHHLFVLGREHADGQPARAHPNAAGYLLRGLDATTQIGEKTLAVYVKLVRAIFYSPIAPISPSGLHRTRIYAGGGGMVEGQGILVKDFGAVVRARVEYAFRDEMSVRQQHRIRDAIRNNPQRAVQSESLRANLATPEMWEITADATDRAEDE